MRKKATEEMVITIRFLYSTGEYSLEDLAKKYGKGLSTIHDIVSNKSFHDESYVFVPRSCYWRMKKNGDG